MLALGFLIMIGMTLIAEGFGAHVPKGYVYAAMAFSTVIEILNILSRRARMKREAAEGLPGTELKRPENQCTPACRRARLTGRDSGATCGGRGCCE